MHYLLVMFNRFFRGFIIFIIFFGLCIETSSAHDPTTPDIIIQVDENGFKPEKVVITQGTKVVFRNIGKDDHWPASDDHPTHTIYSGTSLEEHCSNNDIQTFDSCGAISPFETWSFVFNKTGTFTYHDHLWPHLVGEINVTNQTDKSALHGLLDFFRHLFAKLFSNFSSPQEEPNLKDGNTESDFYLNLKAYYKNLVIETNPRDAILALQKESSQDDRVSALCHDILHEIGHVAYEKYGSFKDAVSFQSDFCNSGFIHGIFESYFKSVSDPLTGLADQCNEYARLSENKKFNLWQCYHGIGHGFMYVTGGDLDRSLELCTENLDYSDGITSCINGVYMELFNLEILAKENEYIDDTNPFLTCSTRNSYKNECYLYVPTYLSQTKRLGFLDIFKECDKTESTYKSVCIYGVGTEAIKRNMDTPNLVFDLCAQAGSYNNQQMCIMGVVDMYMNQEASYSAGQNLCTQVPQKFLRTCHISLENKESFFR